MASGAYGLSPFGLIPFGVGVEENDTGQTISATGVATAEGYGTATLNPGTATLLMAAVASGEAYGTAVLNPGTVTILMLSAASGEAYGTAVLSYTQVVSFTGIDTGEAFGVSVVGDQVIIATVTETIVLPIATAIARGIVKIY